MSLTNPKFRKHCEALFRAAQAKWGRRFLGRKRDRTLAGGTEITGYCDYTAGHDYRYVDWYRCARLDELLSKQFYGNENLYVHLMLDCSASMNLNESANNGNTKFQVAKQITAALSYLALSNLDSLGLLLFSNRVIDHMRPIRGRNRIPQVLKFLNDKTAESTSTDLTHAANQLIQRLPKRGFVVIVSDFFDPAGYQPAVERLCMAGYEPYLLQVLDRSEAEPDWDGGVKIVDPESNQSKRFTVEDFDRENYRLVFEEYTSQLRSFCAKRKIGWSRVFADMPFQECVQRITRTKNTFANAATMSSSISGTPTSASPSGENA